MSRSNWEQSVSMGIILSNRPYNEPGGNLHAQLVLVRKRESGLWGIEAGHLESGESLEEGLCRELFEESNITRDNLEHLRQLPKIREFPGKTKTSLGIWFVGNLKKPIPDEGYLMSTDEIDWVKPFGISELQDIERRNGQGLFRPEFNLSAIKYFLDDAFFDVYANMK